jgi:hypothetical protein
MPSLCIAVTGTKYWEIGGGMNSKIVIGKKRKIIMPRFEFWCAIQGAPTGSISQRGGGYSRGTTWLPVAKGRECWSSGAPPGSFWQKEGEKKKERHQVPSNGRK